MAKKPKIVNGISKPRQRLVLDCRQTNMMFRPSPHTQLGSLSSLCDLELQDSQRLFTAGSDIRDCFYAVRLPPGLEQFFVLREDLTYDEACWVTRFDGSVHVDMSRFCPAIVVLPMGFSWSFFLVQHIHEQSVLRSLNISRDELILDGRPVPHLGSGAVVSLPYCDNVHTLSTDADLCNYSKQKIVRDLEELGFEMHEDEPASLQFETLGGLVDGERGEVRPTARRAWKIKLAFEHVMTIPVSSKTIQKLLGHAIFLSILNRCGMCVFRSLYDFVERHKDSGGRHWLQGREIQECKNFVGLIPLLFTSLRRHWSPIVTCTDASPDGYGVVESVLEPKDVSSLGRWHEKWRFKRLPPEDWNPRRRALGIDVISDPVSVVGVSEEDRLVEQYVVDDTFPEVSHHFLHPSKWETKLMGKWNNTREHITVKEGRALVLAFRRLTRSSNSRGKRHLFLCDNLSLAFAVNKGRAHTYDMLRIVQQLCALSLVGNFSYRVRWIPSELNNADGPSRGQVAAGPFKFQANGAFKACPSETKPQPSDSVRSEAVASDEDDCQEEDSSINSSSKSRRPSKVGAAKTSKESDQIANSSGSWSGEESPARKDDLVGRALSQCRGAAPVQEILGDVREFLPNLRSKLAPRRSDRPRLGGLLGRDVCRGQIIQRGRKSGSSSGVPFPPKEGEPSPQSQGSQRMAQGEATAEPAPIAGVVGSRHGHGTTSPRKTSEGAETACRPRHIPSTWREHRSSRKRPSRSSTGKWTPVQTLQPCGEGRRCREARQSGSLRQQCCPQLPGKGIPGRDLAFESASAQQEGGPHLQLHLCRVQKGLCRGWKPARCRWATSLPTSPWRSKRGPQLRGSRSCVGETARQVAHRSISEEVHQDGQDPAALGQVVTRQLGVLSVVEPKHGTSPSGHDSSTTSGINYGWEDIFKLKKLPKRFCLELFAGTARITSAFLAKGFHAFPVDICIHESHNLLHVQLEHDIINLLHSGRVNFLWIGFPCTSFSVARKNDGLGPGPLRNEWNITGFPWLQGRDLQKVRDGNNLLRVSLRFAEVCQQLGIPYALENPMSSYAWKMPNMIKFIKKFSPTLAHLDYCQYGEDWKKPTIIMGNFWPLQLLAVRCKSSNNVCSLSKQPHVRLTGVDQNGVFKTLLAQPYPRDFCAKVVNLFSNAS